MLASSNLENFWSFGWFVEADRTTACGEEEVGWQPPPLNQIKLNVDGSFDMLTGQSGWGYVLRDPSGGVVDLSCHQGSSNSAFVAEAEALHSAVRRNIERDLGNVIVESDNLGLVEAVNKRKKYSDRAADIFVADLQNLFRLNSNFSLVYIPRKCNLVADWLAKAGRKGTRPFGWDICPPSPLFALLNVEKVGCKSGVG